MRRHVGGRGTDTGDTVEDRQSSTGGFKAKSSTTNIVKFWFRILSWCPCALPHSNVAWIACRVSSHAGSIPLKQFSAEHLRTSRTLMPEIQFGVLFGEMSEVLILQIDQVLRG